MGLNRSMCRLWLPVVIIAVAASCSNRRVSRRQVVLDTMTVSAKNSLMDVYRSSSTKAWEIVHTKAALSFNLKQKTADGKAWITLHPYFYATDTVVLDAKSMRIDTAMALTHNSRQALFFIYRNDQLTIQLGKNYKKEDTLQLYITYTAMPNATTAGGGSAAINDDKGLYFINTDNAIPGKPAQIWTQGETESNSHWLPTIDKPNQRTTVTLELTVPDSFKTLSNGYLLKQEKQAHALRTDVWVMDKAIQVYAIMFAIGNFEIEKESWEGKEVSYYVEPAYKPYARTMFEHTPEMIGYFSSITGVPYPWNKYSQVVVRDYVSGAMENTSASLFGEFMNQDKREHADNDHEDVVSHELFHQWFGDYVTTESWSNITLNESFATYGEQLWRGHKYGKASADMLARKELNSYLYSNKNTPALVRFYYQDKEDLFDRISYQKGSVILRYLNALMGDAAFYKTMQVYLSGNALHAAEATQWRLAAEAVTGQDWNWFFDQWYYKGGHPVLDMQYNYDDAARKLTTTITQSQKGMVYKLPVKVRVLYADGTIVDTMLTIKNKKETYSCSYKGAGQPVVVIDNEHWVVGEVKYDMELWQWLKVWKSSDANIINKILALAEAVTMPEDSNAQAIMNMALQEKEPLIRERTLQLLRQINTKKVQDRYKADVIYMAANDAGNDVKAAAFDVLGAWKISAAKQEMITALADSSYMVAGSALQALGKIDKDTVYDLAKQLLTHNPKGELETTIFDIIGKAGKEADLAFFEERAAYYYGTKKISLAIALSDYLQNVKSDRAFERGISIYKQLVATEAIISYRSSIGTYLVAAASFYKDKSKNVKTTAEQKTAEQRSAILKLAIEQMINAETDEGNKTTYRNYMKTIYR